MSHKNPLRLLQVSITDIDPKSGYGQGAVSRLDGGQDSALVPFTLPGDTAEAHFGRRRNGVLTGRLSAVTTPSPNRATPPCPHFGSCGGCRWQHIPYAMQLQFKQETVEKSFRDLRLQNTRIHPILACTPPWRYRNKMEFSFSSDAKGERYLGLMLHEGRRRVVTLDTCHLVAPWFVEALKACGSWWEQSGIQAYHPYQNRGSLRTLTLREGIRTGDRMAILTVSGNPEDALTPAQVESWVSAMQLHAAPDIAGAQLSLWLRLQVAQRGSPTKFIERHLGGPDHIREQLHLTLHPEPLQCHISPSAFFQPNTLQAERLYSRALELANLQPHETVYDLYCGTGTLTLAAARHVAHAVGIELCAEAIDNARQNALRNELSNVTFHTGDVAAMLNTAQPQGQGARPDLVIVDPPRVGLGPKAIAEIAQLQAQKVLYISCNPQTQAQDVALLRTHGYHLTDLQPVDQFPHTVHIENIALLAAVPATL